MIIEKSKRIKKLVSILNKARDSYYNNSENVMSDYEYDNLYDELTELENETGLQFSNSPTQTVGYPKFSIINREVINNEVSLRPYFIRV